MTDLEIERLRTQLPQEHSGETPVRLHPLAALESLIHVAWLAIVLLGMLVTGFVSYAVFQTKTNLRLDSVEKRLSTIETGQERILDALRIRRIP